MAKQTKTQSPANPRSPAEVAKGINAALDILRDGGIEIVPPDSTPAADIPPLHSLERGPGGEVKTVSPTAILTADEVARQLRERDGSGGEVIPLSFTDALHIGLPAAAVLAIGDAQSEAAFLSGMTESASTPPSPFLLKERDS